MQFKKVQTVLLAIVTGLAAVVVSFSLLKAAPALALERAAPAPAAQAPPADDWVFVVVFTDPAGIEIANLSGNVVGEGLHQGSARCNGDRCSQKTQLSFTIPLTDPDLFGEDYEYKFASRLAFDPVAERVVMAGTGTLTRGNQKEKFAFTATFQNNGDGTVDVRYVASRPDASFIIAKAPGRFEFRIRTQ